MSHNHEIGEVHHHEAHHHTHHEHVHTAECGHIHVRAGNLCAQGLCNHVEHMRANWDEAKLQDTLRNLQDSIEDNEYEVDPTTGKRTKKKKRLVLGYTT